MADSVEDGFGREGVEGWGWVSFEEGGGVAEGGEEGLEVGLDGGDGTDLGGGKLVSLVWLGLVSGRGLETVIGSEKGGLR